MKVRVWLLWALISVLPGGVAAQSSVASPLNLIGGDGPNGSPLRSAEPAGGVLGRMAIQSAGQNTPGRVSVLDRLRSSSLTTATPQLLPGANPLPEFAGLRPGRISSVLGGNRRVLLGGPELGFFSILDALSEQGQIAFPGLELD